MTNQMTFHTFFIKIKKAEFLKWLSPFHFLVHILRSEKEKEKYKEKEKEKGKAAGYFE
jgi:hypothetical protein